MSLDCQRKLTYYLLRLLRFSTLYVLEVWATDPRCCPIKLCFSAFLFSFHLDTPCILCFPPFSIFCFIHSHTLKDCEESVPAEEPRKSMDHSTCDRARNLLCTVDCMSGPVFHWMLQLYLFIFLHFVIGSPPPHKKSKLMRTKSFSHYIHSNYRISQLPIKLLGCTFCFLNLDS